MKERLVILGRLGAGASSVVYKALDISEMRLVAVKMIPISDRLKANLVKNVLILMA